MTTLGNTRSAFAELYQCLRPGPVRVTFWLLVLAAISIRIVFKYGFIDYVNPELWEFEKFAFQFEKSGTLAMRRDGVASAFMPPAYPLLLGVLYKAFTTATAHKVAAVILLICEIIMPFMIGLLASRIWGARVGITALCMALLWPTIITMSGTLHPISIYALILVSLMAIACARENLNWRTTILAGLLLGIYANFRFETPAVVLLFLGCLFFDRIGFRPSDFRRSQVPLAKLVVIAMIYVACATPWVVRNYIAFGEPILSTSGGLNLLRGHHENASGAGRDPWPAGRDNPNIGTPIPTNEVIDALKWEDVQSELIASKESKEMALEFIRNNPQREVELFFTKLYYFLIADFTHPVGRIFLMWFPSLLALGIGAFWWLRQGLHDPKQAMLWGVFSIPMLLSVIFFVLPRFRYAVDFVPLVFLAAWLVQGPLGSLLDRYAFTPESKRAD